MATTFIIAANTALDSDPYTLPINPMQPRGFVSSRPAQAFPTLEGPGGVESPKEWFPTLTFTWPNLVKSNTNHAALLAAFQARKYISTGLDYYIGALVDPTDSWPFPTTWASKKYIQIRIINVAAYENPVDTDMGEVIFDLVVTAKWLDSS